MLHSNFCNDFLPKDLKYFILKNISKSLTTLMNKKQII